MDTKSVRPINDEHFQIVTESLSKLDEIENNSILRAMHWYRHALQSREALERFAFLWIGLETINPMLREYYGLEVEYSKCGKCGHKTTPILNGVRQLLNEMENQSNQSSWGKIRSLRAGILHGFRALKDTVPFSKELIPVLERALGRGLAQITEFEEYDRKKSLDLTHPFPAYYFTQADIQGPDLQRIDKNDIPKFEISLRNFKFEQKGQSHEFRATPKIDKEFSFINVIHSLRCLEQCATSVKFEDITDS